MWLSPSSRLLFRAAAAANILRRLPEEHPIRHWAHLCSTTETTKTTTAAVSSSPPEGGAPESMSVGEAKRLMKLLNLEALKRRLGVETDEFIGYRDFLEACQGMGVAASNDEAAAFAKVLDDAGVILLFRDKVYLHPDKVVDLVRRAAPLALTPDDDPRREELKQLLKNKGEIDVLAHKQVRGLLWTGLGASMAYVGLFFRLTFWEFSWDVMEPIAFFATTSGLVVGYGYFLITSRDPSYEDLLKRLFLSRQKKLFQRRNFNLERLQELQEHCKSPSAHNAG